MRIRQGSRELLYAHPIHGAQTFRPSGAPQEPPEIELVPVGPFHGEMTMADQREWDRLFGSHRDDLFHKMIMDQCRYWDDVRLQRESAAKLAAMSPRARKRRLDRIRKRQQSSATQ